jgi:hypothetical protein
MSAGTRERGNHGEDERKGNGGNGRGSRGRRSFEVGVFGGMKDYERATTAHGSSRTEKWKRGPLFMEGSSSI